MDHPVAVGAQQPEITCLGLLAWFQGVKRLGVVALDEPFPMLSVPFAEVEAASLAGQATKHAQRMFLLCLNDPRVPLIASV
jgi:hypothetical protein